MATLSLELHCQASVAKLGLEHSCNSSAEETRLELPCNFPVEKLGFRHSCGLPAVQLRFELSSDSSATKVGSKLTYDSSVANLGLEMSGDSSVALGFEVSSDPSVAKVGFQHPCDSSAAKLGFELLTFCEKGDVDMALDALLIMDKQGLVLSTHMYGSLLDACKRRKALAQVKIVQAHIARYHLESTSFLGQDLVITLARCGALAEAIQALHSLPHRTVYAWTAVISACVRKQKDSEALEMYQSMQEEGVPPNDFTFVSLLKACTSLRDLGEGQRLHTEALKYSIC